MVRIQRTNWPLSPQQLSDVEVYHTRHRIPRQCTPTPSPSAMYLDNCRRCKVSIQFPASWQLSLVAAASISTRGQGEGVPIHLSLVCPARVAIVRRRYRHCNPIDQLPTLGGVKREDHFIAPATDGMMIDQAESQRIFASLCDAGIRKRRIYSHGVGNSRDLHERFASAERPGSRGGELIHHFRRRNPLACILWFCLSRRKRFATPTRLRPFIIPGA